MRRRLFNDLLLATLVAGCTAPGSQPVPRPLAGTPTADPVFPPIGARWTVRVTDSGLFHSSVQDQSIVATEVDFKGRRGYGLVGPPVTEVLDPLTFNPVGTIVGGNVTVIDAPDVNRFSWPLWVGKAWTARNAHSDLAKGMMFLPAPSEARVEGIENVTVPAGAFQAFRIAYQGGINSSSFGGGPRTRSTPGFETRATYWYAPAAKMLVKSEVIRLGTNYLGATTTTTELLTLPR